MLDAGRHTLFNVLMTQHTRDGSQKIRNGSASDIKVGRYPGSVSHGVASAYTDLQDSCRLVAGRVVRHFFLPSIQSAREREPLARSGVEQPGPGASLASLSQLIRWLSATGEYEQEALRLRNWREYLATHSPEIAPHCMSAAVESFDDFAAEAASRLGTFTEGVSRFLSGEYARRGCREDQIFCSRPPIEYHLNMVAADVMNRGLQNAFERTTRKVVLVPGCMRGEKAATCKAHIDGVDMTCMACDPDCAVNRITRRMRKLGARVYLVPHSTGFSRWLDRWGREPDSALLLGTR